MKYLIKFEKYTKMKWELLSSNPDKKIDGKRLIDIVENAYKNTKYGSFVKTMQDVLKSHWLVIDCDEYDDIDACIFYRNPRQDEDWVGYKIQGIGHDGDKKAKSLFIKKLIEILNKKGYWIEVSGKLEYVLSKYLTPITDIDILNKLFPNSKIELLSNGYYKRTLNDNWITEKVFGKPIFKK